MIQRFLSNPSNPQGPYPQLALTIKINVASSQLKNTYLHGPKHPAGKYNQRIKWLVYIFNGLRNHSVDIGLKPCEMLVRQLFLISDFLLDNKIAAQI